MEILNAFTRFRTRRWQYAFWLLVLIGSDVANAWPENPASDVNPPIEIETPSIESSPSFLRGPFIQNTTTNSTQIIWRTALSGIGQVAFGETMELESGLLHTSDVSTHVTTLQGLKSDTRYFYQVTSQSGEETLQSPIEWFRTLKESGDVQFTVFGDSGAASVAQYRLAETMRTTGADLVLHTGDVVYDGFDDVSVGARFYDVYQPHIKNIPYYLCIGNHDIEFGADFNAAKFREAFYLPTNSSTHTEHFYSFDHGDVHFAGLFNPWYYNYIPQAEDVQWQWLARDLAESQKPWKVVFMHMPMINSGGHAFQDQNLNFVLDQSELVDVLLPIATAHNVDLIIAGHDHNFQSFAPTNGVTHLITGGGGASLYGLAGWHPATTQFHAVHHFVQIQVSQATATVQAIDANGQSFASFQVSKTWPKDQIYPSTLHRPTFPPQTSSDLDGNGYGQSFDFAGSPIRSRTGSFSCLGELFVNNDGHQISIGLKDVRLYPDDLILMFLETDNASGLAELPHEFILHSDSDETQSLPIHLSKAIQFEGFRPNFLALLGDEFADGVVFPDIVDVHSKPQGIFQLTEMGAFAKPQFPLQQFNRSPQTQPVPYEEHADFIQFAIPWTMSQTPDPSMIRVAAMVFRSEPLQPLRIEPDTGGLAVNRIESENSLQLYPVEIRLAKLPENDMDFDSLPDDWEAAHQLDTTTHLGKNGPSGDPDGDGMSNLEEFLAGTNPLDATSNLKLTLTRFSVEEIRLSWKERTGKRYVLEQSVALDFEEAETLEPSLPERNSEVEEPFIEQRMNIRIRPDQPMFFRIKVLP